MSEIAIKIKNLPQIKHAFGLAPRLMTKELNTAIRKSIFTVSRKSQTNLSGVMVNVQTGRLRSSNYSRYRNLAGETGYNVYYDKFVHDGTRYMQARPYLGKATEDSDLEIQQFFTTAVNVVLHKIGKMI